MKDSKLPKWVKDWGIIGIISVFGVYLFQLAFEAIVQQTIVEFWNKTMLPVFVKNFEFRFSLLGWQIFLLVSIIALLLVVLILNYKKIVMYLFHSHKPDANPPIPLPSGSYNQAEVIRAVSMARRKEIQIDEMCKIVEQTINLKKLKPEVGAELLSEFGYILVVETDGDYHAMKRRSDNNE